MVAYNSLGFNVIEDTTYTIFASIYDIDNDEYAYYPVEYNNGYLSSGEWVFDLENSIVYLDDIDVTENVTINSTPIKDLFINIIGFRGYY